MGIIKTKQEILDAVNNKRLLISKVPKKFLKDRDVVLALVKRNGEYLNSAKDFWNDKEMVFEAIKTWSQIFYTEEILQDRDFMLKCVKENPDVLFQIYYGQMADKCPRYIDKKSFDACHEFDIKSIMLKDLVSRADLSNDFVYLGVVGLAEVRVKRTVYRKLYAMGINVEDSLPEELELSLQEKLTEVTQTIETARQSQQQERKSKLNAAIMDLEV